MLSGLLLTAVLTLRAQGTIADYQRFSTLSERVRESGFEMPQGAQAIGSSHRFWYRIGDRFITVDAATGAKSPAFDTAKLADSLSKATGATVKPERIAISNLTFIDDDKAVEFVHNETRRRMNLKTYAMESLPARRGDSRNIRSLPGPRVAEVDRPVSSPDGKHEAFLRNYNLWVRTKGAKDAAPLSTDGSEGDYYALSNNAWSPDSKKIVVYRVRPGQRRKIAYIESSPADQVQPKSSFMEYAKPGDTLDIPRPILFHVETRKQFTVDNALFANPYLLTALQWRADSRAFTFEYNQRGHQVYRVMEVDAASGKPRALVNEEATTFFCYYSKKFAHHVDDGKEVVWMSERDGWNHLYLYDGAAGKVKNAITRGADFVVRTVLKVDDKSRRIWFLASGMHTGKDPYYLHATA